MVKLINMITTGQTAISFEELNELNELIFRIHGFDFKGYSPASLKRRVTRIMHLHHLDFFGLKMQLANDSTFFDKFLTDVTVNVTEMFRDPSFYKTVREKVLPYLSSYPRLKLWSAGCSTGEEAYSLAILLEEEGLFERSFIYGTDINTKVLQTAKEGIYDLKKMRVYSENYRLSQTKYSLSNYYTAKYDAAAMQARLKKNMLFSVHNLCMDSVFNEFQLICCRNVLIYFNSELQKKVIDLFYNSLSPLGFLCLGSKETLRGDEKLKRFKMVDSRENIFQKIA